MDSLVVVMNQVKSARKLENLRTMMKMVRFWIANIQSNDMYLKNMIPYSTVGLMIVNLYVLL